MSSVNKNKKSLATEALLELESMKGLVKEQSKLIMKDLLSETVKNAIREEISDDSEDEDEYSVEEEPVENENDDETSNEDKESGECTEDGCENGDDTCAAEEDGECADEESGEETEESQDGEGDEWSEFEEYKTDDNTYDLSGEEDDEKIVKVFKLLKNGDEVLVKTEGDKITLKDNANDTEYVITTDDPDVNVEQVDSPEDGEFEVDDDEEEMNNEPEMYEGKMSRKEPIFEIHLTEDNLGYTDNYQDKDPIEGLSNEEPSKSGKSWHKGVPTDTKKPWAGKGSSKPFDKKVSESDEEEGSLITDENIQENVGGAVKQRTQVKDYVPSGRKSYGPHNKKKISAAGKYEGDENGTTSESIKKRLAIAEALNKKYEERLNELEKCLPAFKKGLTEAILTNEKLGKFARIVIENSTSKEEKRNFVARLDEAKSSKECKAIYESITRELKNTKKPALALEGKQIAAKSTINETTVYQSDDVMQSLDLIRRMGC